MVQHLNRELIDRVTAEALRSPRKRMNYNFHSGPGDNPHRFLNVMLRGTYVQPHRHLRPPKTEGFLAIEGCGAVICFNEDGVILSRHIIGEGPVPHSFSSAPRSIGVDIPAGVWHSVVVFSDILVCYEVKPGPWDPSTDKDFAAWAPDESSTEVAAYLARIGD